MKKLPVDQRRRVLLIHMDPAVIAEADAIRGSKSRARFIEDATREKVGPPRDPQCDTCNSRPLHPAEHPCFFCDGRSHYQPK